IEWVREHLLPVMTDRVSDAELSEARFDLSGLPLAIPDRSGRDLTCGSRSAESVEASVEVTEDFAIAGLHLQAKIPHERVEDLRVALLHNGRTVKELHACSGGQGAGVLELDVQLDELEGRRAAGLWSLRVADH